jgi:hypothetical protein
MKIFFSILLLLAVSSESKAELVDQFFLKKFVTIEYNSPKLSSEGFKPNSIEKQIFNFENIALGFNGRIHKYIGLNVNFSRGDLSNNGNGETGKSSINFKQYNISSLFYAPLVEDGIVEFFGEIGASDINSKFSFSDSQGNFSTTKSHQTLPFFGAGFQVMPFKSSDDAIRIAFQKYIGKLSSSGSTLTVVRLGFIKEF